MRVFSTAFAVMMVATLHLASKPPIAFVDAATLTEQLVADLLDKANGGDKAARQAIIDLFKKTMPMKKSKPTNKAVAAAKKIVHETQAYSAANYINTEMHIVDGDSDYFVRQICTSNGDCYQCIRPSQITAGADNSSTGNQRVQCSSFGLSAPLK